MDILSAFKTEIFRPLADIVIPGAFALGPYVLLANEYHNREISKFWGENPSAFVAILLICVVTAGMILEDAGSLVESKLWKRLIKRKNPSYDSEWEQYLKLPMKDEYVGQRYLRTIVVRLKFELSMGPAILIALAGIVWFNYKCSIWRASTLVGVVIAMAGLATYLLWESYQSTKVLAETHKIMIEAVTKKIRPGCRSSFE